MLDSDECAPKHQDRSCGPRDQRMTNSGQKHSETAGEHDQPCHLPEGLHGGFCAGQLTNGRARVESSSPPSDTTAKGRSGEIPAGLSCVRSRLPRARPAPSGRRGTGGGPCRSASGRLRGSRTRATPGTPEAPARKGEFRRGGLVDREGGQRREAAISATRPRTRNQPPTRAAPMRGTNMTVVRPTPPSHHIRTRTVRRKARVTSWVYGAQGSW